MKHLLTDQLGDYGLYDLPGLMFSVVMAALLTWILTFAVRSESSRWKPVMLSVAVAIAVSICRTSLPLAMALVAVALMIKEFLSDDGSRGYLMLAGGVMGFLCGARSSMIAIVMLVPLFLLLRAVYGKRAAQ